MTLGGAVTGYQTWSGSGFTNNDTGYYCIEHQSAAEWEVGLGTWTTGGVLVRTTPISGSAATPVSFTAGTKHVFLTDPASAQTRITDLSAETALADADEFVIWDASASTTDKITAANVKDYVENAPVFAAGTASAGTWPKLTSGTLMTTAEVGALELDANALYATTDAGNRGVVSVEHWIRANATRTFTSNTTQQAIFNSPTNGRLTLETGTYFFECLVSMDTMSATSGNGKFSLNSGGTATLAQILYQTGGRDAALDALGNTTGVAETTATVAATNVATASTATVLTFHVVGTFKVTVAGTIIPSFAQTTAAAAVVKVGSFFMCKRIGSDSLVSVGQWD
jgi:hypothetical protein